MQQRRKQFVSVLALAVALAAIVPTLAQARPNESVANDRAHYPAYYEDPGSAPAAKSGMGVDDRALPRGTSFEPASIVVTKDGGTSVDFGNSYVAGLALMLGFLAGATLVAIRNSRKQKLSPA